MGLFERFKIHKPTAKERQAKIIGDPFKIRKRKEHSITKFKIPTSIKRVGKMAFERFKEASIEAAERAKEEEKAHPRKTMAESIREESIRLHKARFGKGGFGENPFLK